MTRTLDDALDPNNIPAGSRCVAYYTDVLTPVEARARWPGALLVSVDRVPEQTMGLVDDCESGALTVAQLPARAAAKRAAGIRFPWAYCSEAPWPAVRLAFTGAGVPEPLYWIAAPGALAEGLLAGTVATQRVYAGPYDQSALADFVPGLDQPLEDPPMLLVAEAPAGGWFLLIGTTLVGPLASADLAAYQNAGVQCAALSQAGWAQLEAATAPPAAAAAPAPVAQGPMTLELTGTATPSTAAAATNAAPTS